MLVFALREPVEIFVDGASGTDEVLEDITPLQENITQTPEHSVSSPFFQSTEETQRTESQFDVARAGGVRLSFPDTVQRAISTSSGSKRYVVLVLICVVLHTQEFQWMRNPSEAMYE
jgi:hypothetical protein